MWPYSNNSIIKCLMSATYVSVCLSLLTFFTAYKCYCVVGTINFLFTGEEAEGTKWDL